MIISLLRSACRLLVALVFPPSPYGGSRDVPRPLRGVSRGSRYPNPHDFDFVWSRDDDEVGR